MINLKELRKDPEAFKSKLRGKRFDEEVFDRLVKLDIEHQELIIEVEALRRERNKLSRLVGRVD